jgi:DNA-directed RNA polymerase specialized sigma24 family protein
MSTTNASITSEIARYVPILRGVSFALTGHRASADNLVEKVIIRFFTNPLGTPRGESVKLQMLSILHDFHYIGGDSRRSTTRSFGKERRNTPTAPAIQRDNSVPSSFDSAFWQLCDSERELLILKQVEGLSIADVAQICGCTQGMIDVRLPHAHRKLARLLCKDGRRVSCLASLASLAACSAGSVVTN